MSRRVVLLVAIGAVPWTWFLLRDHLGELGDLVSLGLPVLALPCVGCHMVQGTTAQGLVGPDLSHVASKKSIAGGAISPVNEDTLTRWLKNPPAMKPGTAMPNLGLSDEQVHDIVQWLLTLK